MCELCSSTLMLADDLAQPGGPPGELHPARRQVARRPRLDPSQQYLVLRQQPPRRDVTLPGARSPSGRPQRPGGGCVSVAPRVCLNHLCQHDPPTRPLDLLHPFVRRHAGRAADVLGRCHGRLVDPLGRHRAARRTGQGGGRGQLPRRQHSREDARHLRIGLAPRVAVVAHQQTGKRARRPLRPPTVAGAGARPIPRKLNRQDLLLIHDPVGKVARSRIYNGACSFRIVMKARIQPGWSGQARPDTTLPSTTASPSTHSAPPARMSSARAG